MPRTAKKISSKTTPVTYASAGVDGTSSLDWSVEQVLGALRTRGLMPTHNDAYDLEPEQEPLGLS